jgi:hypothetical protein
MIVSVTGRVVEVSGLTRGVGADQYSCRLTLIRNIRVRKIGYRRAISSHFKPTFVTVSHNGLPSTARIYQAFVIAWTVLHIPIVVSPQIVAHFMSKD